MTGPFIRGTKLNICLVYIIQSYFAVPKSIRLNSKHYSIIKVTKNSADGRISNTRKYGIDKKAAQIWALSSNKIHIYEYLTGLEILPSDQSINTEKTKFLYSPLEKAFEKVEIQGGKQIKAFEEHGKQLVDSNALFKKYDFEKDDPSFLKQKEIFDKVFIKCVMKYWN